MDIRVPDRKIIILVFILLIVSASAITFLSFQTRDALKEAVRNELRSVSISIATQIDGDSLANLKPGDENSPEFLAIRDALYRAQNMNPEIRYIYTMRRVGDRVEFIVDGEYGYAANAAVIGQAYPNPTADMIQGFSGSSADTDFTSDMWGIVLSGYYPVRNSSGDVVGLVGVDMAQQKVVGRQNYINWGFYIVLIIFILLVALGVVWVERVRGEAILNITENEQKFRSLAETTTSGIFILKSGKFLYTNPALSHITGYSGDELSSLDYLEIIHPDFREMVRDRNLAREKGEIVPSYYEIKIVSKGGSEKWVNLAVGRIFCNGSPAIVGTVSDITDLKDSAYTLQEMNKKLNLMSSITRHDIRNSLTALLWTLELVQAGCRDPDNAEKLKRVEDAGYAIQDHLESARIYQEIGIRSPEWQDAEKVVMKAAKSIDMDGVVLTTDLAGVSVYADPLLERVFYNLIQNSLRHGGTVTKIHISAVRDLSDLILAFEDNGCGIPDKEKEKIFQPGYGKNTGYGLFISRELLGITKTTLTENGTAGKGARFEMRFPEGTFRFRG